FPDIRDSHGAPCTSSGSALKFSASREPLKLWETVSTTATASVITQDQKAPGTAIPEPEPSSISGTAPTWGAEPVFPEIISTLMRETPRPEKQMPSNLTAALWRKNPIL